MNEEQIGTTILTNTIVRSYIRKSLAAFISSEIHTVDPRPSMQNLKKTIKDSGRFILSSPIVRKQELIS